MRKDNKTDPRPEDEAIDLYLAKIRQNRPLIHHITNQVTMNDCANTAYAIGARPTKAFDVTEAKQAAGKADAVVWNLGTFHPAMVSAIRASLPVVGRRALPVVIDPVAAQSYPGRGEFLLEILSAFEKMHQQNLLKCRIIIRCNGSELASLNEALRSPCHPVNNSPQSGGVDDLTLPGDQIEICRTFLNIFRERLPICIVMTGSTDYIGWTDPRGADTRGSESVDADLVRTALNGVCTLQPAASYPQLSLSQSCPLLTCMTGAGCMSNTLIAAFACAADADGDRDCAGPVGQVGQVEHVGYKGQTGQVGKAARLALTFLVRSAQEAQRNSRGMGTFRVNLMDEMSRNIMN